MRLARGYTTWEEWAASRPPDDRWERCVHCGLIFDLDHLLMFDLEYGDPREEWLEVCKTCADANPHNPWLHRAYIPHWGVKPIRDFNPIRDDEVSFYRHGL